MPASYTSRQKVGFLRDVHRLTKHGIPPSLRELADHWGVRSADAASGRVDSLRRDGLVRRGRTTGGKAQSRGLVLTEKGRRLLSVESSGRFIPIFKCSLCGASRAGEGDCPTPWCNGVAWREQAGGAHG